MSLVTVDAVLVVQVLENLLDNACKYSVPASPIIISAYASNNQIEVAVWDWEIGIPTTALERIFDKFYRVQRQEIIAGTGLGLSICKGIIEAYGGQIWAANNPDHGIKITFSLPVHLEGLEWTTTISTAY